MIYTRVSTGGQEENTSLAAQFAACSRKAQEMGAEVVAHEEEVLSGGLYLARPKLQAALELIESGRASAMIVYRLDRTGRDVDGLRDIRRRIERAGGQLVFADGMQFERSAVGDLMFTQMGAFAEFERATIRERTMRGQIQVALSGRVPNRSMAAYGYRIVSKEDAIRGTHTREQVGSFEIVEEERALVEAIFSQYLQLRSLRQVGTWLMENGFRTRGGRPWKPNGVRQVILNPIYKGEHHWRKTRRIIDESRLSQGRELSYTRPRDESEHILIPAPPLVSVETWQAAQDLMREGRAMRSGAPSARYILTGITYCALCGRRMYAQKRASKHAQVGEYYVRCAATWRYTPNAPSSCERVGYGGLVVERLLIDTLCHLLENPSVTREAQARALRARQEAREKAQSRRDSDPVRLGREIERLRQKELAAASAALDARIDGADPSAYETLRLQAEASRQALEARLASVEVAAEPDAASSTWALEPEMAQSIVAALRSPEVEAGDKAAIVSSLIRRVYPIHIRDVPHATRAIVTTGGVAVLLRMPGPFDLVARTLIVKRGQRGRYTQLDHSLEALDECPLPFDPCLHDKNAVR